MIFLKPLTCGILPSWPFNSTHVSFWLFSYRISCSQMVWNVIGRWKVTSPFTFPLSLFPFQSLHVFQACAKGILLGSGGVMVSLRPEFKISFSRVVCMLKLKLTPSQYRRRFFTLFLILWPQGVLIWIEAVNWDNYIKKSLKYRCIYSLESNHKW